MKHVLFLLLLCTLPMIAQDQTVQTNRLVVYGEGAVDSPANRAQTSFTVVGLGSSIRDAMGAARGKLAAIAKKLFSLGLTDKNLLTSNFYSGDNPQGRAFLSSSKDFRTQLDVLITIDSLNWIDDVIVVLAGSEVERLSNISFSLKSDSLLRVEARERAVSNALEKARIMASQLGTQLGRVLYLEEIFGLPRAPIGPPEAQYLSIQRNMTSTVRLEQQGIAFYGGQRFTSNSFVKVIFEIR